MQAHPHTHSCVDPHGSWQANVFIHPHTGFGAIKMEDDVGKVNVVGQCPQKSPCPVGCLCHCLSAPVSSGVTQEHVIADFFRWLLGVSPHPGKASKIVRKDTTCTPWRRPNTHTHSHTPRSTQHTPFLTHTHTHKYVFPDTQSDTTYPTTHTNTYSHMPSHYPAPPSSLYTHTLSRRHQYFNTPGSTCSGICFDGFSERAFVWGWGGWVGGQFRVGCL